MDAETRGRGIACWQPPAPVLPADRPALAPDLIELTTGGADIQPGGDANFAGPIEIRTQGKLLQADSASYSSEAGVFSATGTIQFRDEQARVSGTAARYDTRSGQFSFADAEFEVYQTPARGSAESVNVFKEGVLELDRVTYTSCPPGNTDWLLRAREIELDTEKGTGTARGASLRFKGVPFFYVPYFTYPITDQRKTGLLFPTFATSDQRGFELTQPIYWNIAPNYDATFQPRYMSNRGLQLGAETRLLLPANRAELNGDYLPSDEGTGTARWRYDLTTTSMLPKGWRAQINAQGVSDQTYFEDLSQRQVLTSRPNLVRELTFEYFGDIWSVTALAQGYQNLDPIITPEQEPYLQLPQVAIAGVLRDGLFGLDYRLDSEATYFYRDDSVTGARVHVQPEISLPLRRGGLFFTPQVALDYTTYALQDQEAGADDTPGRAAPIVSIDTGAVFDRLAGRNQNYLITLEPRALYAYVPFRDQSDIPVFDTIRPNFNLIQLYRRNQFIGFDRLSDTNQISLGASSRVLNANDGRQLLTATIGQTIFLDDSNVVLPDEAPSSADSTDYIGELAVDIWRTWGLDFRYQYDADTKETARTSVRLRLRPDEFKAVNIAYRFVQDSIEQTDISFAWPLGESWDFIGRYNYSLRDNKALDRFVGFEYNGCCWGISLLGRRTVQRSTGQSDSAIGFQFILKGFSNLGSKTSRELKRDILGGMRYR
ncbi:MAG: LPS assembly protein LptD [Gammaproteobacteria bacterium]|jgi:LPS-assembly protein|nr:LPS assembly protein LptD [Gammaproteobacteria bacterium]